MNAFAYLINPVDLEQLKAFWPVTRIMPERLLRSFFKRTISCKVFNLRGIQSAAGSAIEGYLIIDPMLLGHLLTLKAEALSEKIAAVNQMAFDLGARLLGTDCCVTLPDTRVPFAKKTLKLPVNSGCALTAWAIFESAFHASKELGTDLKHGSVAVLGAGSAVGSLCARKLSFYTSKMTLSDSDPQALAGLKHDMKELNGSDPVLKAAPEAIGDADIVVAVTHIPEGSLDMGLFKPRAVICDATYSHCLFSKRSLRQDITIIRAGLMKLPYPVDFKVSFGLPENVVFASLAEAMLLAFEGKFLNYSLGTHINLDKLEDIANIAVRHGFEVYAQSKG